MVTNMWQYITVITYIVIIIIIIIIANFVIGPRAVKSAR
jgi:hypothetical protein